MKLDMANFTITVQRRALNACSADYERDKFAEYLKVKPGKSHYGIYIYYIQLINLNSSYTN